MNEVLRSQLYLFGYFLGFAIPTAILGRIFSWRKETVRKIYHIFGSATIILLIRWFPDWITGLATFYGMFLSILLLIYLFEKMTIFKPYRIDRKGQKNDIKKQIIYVCLVYTFLTLVFWAPGDKSSLIFIYLGISTWSLGDSFAALVGSRYGKNRITIPLADHNKTYEGLMAFVCFASLGNGLILYFHGSLSLICSILLGIIFSIIGGIFEVLSKKGLDTLTIPIGVSLLSYLVLRFMLDIN